MYIRIDPHVHDRDDEEAYKETIAHIFKVANEQGVKVICAMPNTHTPVTLEYDVEKRLSLVPANQKENYFLYLGLTINQDQLVEAVSVYNRCKQVIGFKLYAGESVGNLAVTDPEKQLWIYKVLTNLNYTGVLAAHCERKDLLKPELWNPLNPMSHSKARPKEAEIEAVRDQIRFANQTKFKGILHIVHVSCAESVELIKMARQNIKITCAVTPHHILYAQEIQMERGGLLYKINPPLRSLQDIEKLRHCLLRGEIDWIETDHAPHAVGEKLFPPYLSGFPSLYLYKDFVTKFLPSVGASEDLIKKMTHDNIVNAFSEKIGGLK